MAISSHSAVALLCALAAVVALLSVPAAAVAADKATERQFGAWMAQHHKSYASPDEFRYRLAVFADNLLRIAELNKQGEATYAVNALADLTPEEIAATRRMAPSAAPELQRDAAAAAAAAQGPQPASWDWRQEGVVTPVKNQGSAGTCWSFSTTGNLEGQWALATKTLTSFSEEQLVECDSGNCGVFGGWPYLAYEWIINNGGLETEQDYPYCAGNGDCYPCMADTNKTFCGPGPSYCNTTCHQQASALAGKISSWAAMSTNETEIAAQLVQTGPLSVLLNAETLSFYHSGVWDPLLCSPTSLDHAVLLVGYGVEKSLFGDKPFWLVKNSWGTDWGMDGYFMIARGKGKCGINTSVTTAVV